MEMFNGGIRHRWTPTNSDAAFSEDLTPFPDVVEFSYGQIQAENPPQPLLDHHHHTPVQRPPPPQKLQPIRHQNRKPPDTSDPIGKRVVLQNVSGSEMMCFSHQSAQLGFTPQMTPSPGNGWHDFAGDQRLECGSSSGGDGGGGGCLQSVKVNVQESDDDVMLNLKRQIREFDFSSSSSDETGDLSQGKVQTESQNTRKRRKKLENFVEHMMTIVMQKQEQMHKKVMDLMEKMEAETIIREEAWKQQQLEQAKREEAMRAEEASRSRALNSLIQSVLKQNSQVPQPSQSRSWEEDEDETPVQYDPNLDTSKKRWLKSEVQALIMLRTASDYKFRATGSKTLLWEEISVGMAAVGYSQSAKKCKEKWDNINKYFRRLKESGTKHLESSKQCPYFQELEILYRAGFLTTVGL